MFAHRSMKRSRWGISVSFSLLFAVVTLFAQRATPPLLPAPVAVEPIAAIINAFRSHDVVGLSAGEGHGDERGLGFLLSLIRDPRFAGISVDIVTENGNAR